jgi:3-oxoadipate enol-lactonase/4-carboxymuconolactone decarboxylase
VLRYDHRGHGRSGAPRGPYTIEDLSGDVVRLLDELSVERASVVGLSLGGMVAMRLAISHPERVDRIVLCCTAPQLGTAESWAERAALVRAQGTGVMTPVLLERWLTPGFRAAHPEAVAAVTAMLAAADAEGYAACCEAIGAMDLREDLTRISAPALVVAGALDPVVPPALAVELQGAVPGAALVVLADAAHLANLEHPRRFSGVVLDHLLGLPAHRGEAVRRSVLGDEHVDRALAAASPFTAPFQDLLTRWAWGDVWSRPGLDHRVRRLVTIAVLGALGRHEELDLHVRAALAHGVSADELREVLLHCAVYAGIPAANSAFTIARRAVEEAGGREDAPT